MVNAPECMNESPTCTASDTELTQPCSGPVLFELIDKDGNIVTLRESYSGKIKSLTFDSAANAASYARTVWPDQTQDEERSGRGWDVQIAGADR